MNGASQCSIALIDGSKQIMGKIIYILEFSLAHTLSAKHRTSLPKIFKKYGRPFVVSRTESDIIVFAKPERLKS